MVLLSGEVETREVSRKVHGVAGSGWFCYPGKLKPDDQVAGASADGVPDGFAIRGS